MKTLVYIAAIVASTLMAGCQEESNPTRGASPIQSNPQYSSDQTDNTVTETGLEEFAMVLSLAFERVSLEFHSDIASLRDEAGNRCLSGSFVITDRSPGNYDEAIEGALSNCESIANAVRENGRFYVSEKQDSGLSESFVEFGIDNNFVNRVEQFDDAVVISNAYQGTALERRSAQSDERITDVQFLRDGSNGLILEGTQTTQVVFDIANNNGTVGGQIVIDRFNLNSPGNCLSTARYTLSTSTPFQTRFGNEFPNEIPLTGGSINISRPGQSALVSFTDEGFIRVTSGNRSEDFSSSELETLCSHS